jgi:hypothetical protein
VEGQPRQTWGRLTKQMSERDSPIEACGFGRVVQRLPHSLCCIEGRSQQKAQPWMSQLGGGLCLSPQRLRGHKALQIKRLCPREHVIHGAAQLVGEYGQRFGFAVFVFECGKIFFPGLTLADEKHGGFRKRPP